MNGVSKTIAAAAIAAIAAVTAGAGAANASPAGKGRAGSIIHATGVRPGAIRHISSSSQAGSLTLKPTSAYADLDSDNWSGYVTPQVSGKYTGTTTVFTVPTGITCGSTDTASSFWAGVDGWGDNTVEQDGIEANCTGGAPSLYAWVETYPAYQEEIVTDTGAPAPVEPGDSITSMVTEVSPSEYDLYLEDQTQGWYFSGDLAMPSGYTGEDLTSEVITEATTECDPACEIMPLTDFASVSYNPSYYWYNGGNSDAFYTRSDTTRVDLYQKGVEADGVASLGTDGAFTVTYGTPRVSVTNPGSQSATAGVPVTLQIQASPDGALALSSYVASGLPPGLSIRAATGLISGTPRTAGTYHVTVTVSDTAGASASVAFTWTIKKLAAPRPRLCGTRSETRLEVCWAVVAHATSYSGSLAKHGHRFTTKSLHVTFRGLKRDTTYHLQIRAENAAGSSTVVMLSVRTKK